MTTSHLARAVADIRRAAAEAPTSAVIAGSGLGGLADRMSDAVSVPYSEIGGWPRSTVAGHEGELVIGRLSGVVVAVAKGRVHLYEGYTAQDVSFAVRALHGLGVRTLVVTNAAGALNPGFDAGDVMVIRDHINLPALVGESPLRGPNDECGPRFPLMTGAYDGRLRQTFAQEAAGAGLRVREGVYAMVAGPSFETPAEARLLRLLGADAVGMSTAPEVTAARHRGIWVLGISVITNLVATALPDEGPEGPRVGRAAGEAGRPRDEPQGAPGAVKATGIADGRPAPQAQSVHHEVTEVAGAVAPALVAALEAWFAGPGPRA